MDYILTYLIQYYPQIAIYFVVLIFVVTVTIKATNFYASTRKLHKKMPGIEKTLSNIDKGLSLLNQVLIEKTIISQSCYSNENSPRAINSVGQQLLDASGANPVFEAGKDGFARELEEKKIGSLLELEQESLNVMLAHRDDPEFKPLQDFVFEHPTFNALPLTYTDVLFVIALKLRDFYRERHPELISE